MCGISGQFYFDRNRQINYQELEKMNNVLFHRGPDDDGYYIDNNIGLAQRRLSIIDLKNGKQPIYNEDKTIIAVCNGEIYNYKELTRDLKNRGHSFKTQTDVEVIVHLYEEMGMDFPKKLEGMYAIALWDKKKQKLLLSRDHAGIKPLFYYIDNNVLSFSSELKGILKNNNFQKILNLEALIDYFKYSFIPDDKSIFQNCFKVKPGTVMVVEQNGSFSEKYYWKIQDYVKVKDFTYNTYIKHAYELMNKAVESHLVSDVPFGCFLSGGIDSSLVAAFMSKNFNQPIKTFSIGFEDEKYNELDKARIVSDLFKTDHHEYIVKPNIEEIVNLLAKQYDEPFADPSSIPTYLVSQMASNEVKMCLSGDGGDELFGGYRRYQASINKLWYDNIPGAFKGLSSLISNNIPYGMKGKTLLHQISLNKIDRYVESISIFSNNDLKILFNSQVQILLKSYDTNDSITKHFGDKSDFINQMGIVDYNTYLINSNLQKVDRASMLNSIEVRVPFVDRGLVEFAFSIPGDSKIKNGDLKIIPKLIASKLLPKEIVNAPKKGFAVPIENWLRNDLNGFLNDIIFDSNSLTGDYFNRRFIQKIFKNHKNGKNYSRQLWAIMNFELWARNYL